MSSLECRFTFLGTGPSNALPNLRCCLQPEANCRVCLDGLTNPDSKNRRGNPSLLVTVTDAEGVRRDLLVDIGKTFLEAARRFFPPLGVRGLAAVLLTHAHADAMLGLDNLREVQLAAEPPDVWRVSTSTPVFGTALTLREVAQRFSWMFPAGGDPNRGTGGCVPREVEPGEAFRPIPGLEVRPVALRHGGDYIALGFVFGGQGEFIYLSDVSEVPLETMEILRRCSADVLVVDALLKSGPRYPHFGLEQALALVRALRPKKALLIGMACEFDHDRDDAELRELAAEGLDVSLSYDGLSITLELAPAAPVVGGAERPGGAAEPSSVASSRDLQGVLPLS